MLLKISAATAVAMFAVWTVGAQTPTTPSFEVASVKPGTPGPWRESKAGVDRIDFPNATLRSCLAFAYGVKEYQISGPSWLGDVRYDIVAKGPEGTRHEQLAAMMQSLLAERFKLQVHHETKEFNVVLLSVAKGGAKLKESPVEPGVAESGARIGMSMGANGVGRMEVKQGNMTSLANTLTRLVGMPVVDITGLTKRYDFEMEYTGEDARGNLVPVNTGPAPPAAGIPGSSVFSSIQQLGLRLDARKHPMDNIVVDRMEKVATEN